MILTKLHLRHFKGIRRFDLATQGRSVSIFADNGFGKTSVGDAITYLLFGKNLEGKSDFEIKTLDENNEPIHRLEHLVEAEFDLGGDTIELRKVYKEVWTRPKGRHTDEFSGHTTEYFVDKVPVQKKEYDDRIKGICDEKTFRNLTNPTQLLARTDWKERRELLLKVGGDVSDAEVIAANPELAPLTKILGQRSVDDTKRRLAATLKELNKTIGEIPVRISTLEDSKPPMPSGKPVNLLPLQDELTKLLDRKSRISAGGESAELQVKLRTIDAELLQVQNEVQSRPNPEREKALAAKSAIEARQTKLQTLARSKKREIAQADETIADLGRKLDRFRAEFAQIKGEVWEGSTFCSACKRDLPEDQVETAKAGFEASRNERLATNREKGRAAKLALEAEIEKLAELKAELVDMESLEDKCVTELNDVVIPPFVNSGAYAFDPRYEAKVAEKIAVQAQIDKIAEGQTDSLADLTNEIAALRSKIADAEKIVAQADQVNRVESQIVALETELKGLADQHETHSGHMNLCEEFIRVKVSMLTEKINSKFKLTQWKLFENQINGGLTECCEAMHGGVPYPSLNLAMRINCGLDVIEAVGAHIGFRPPIVIDNAESVTAMLATTAQQIRLVVSEPDKELRVETIDPTNRLATLFS